jgi:glycosyltransferase involved in cell wall biosynthesis
MDEKNQKELISVLMTSYNRESYISEAIESVLNSTYDFFELIIVDDCSNDGTLEIARFYEKSDSRIKVYQNEFNLGDYPNRNRAASFAQGEYLKYLDSDDTMTPNCLEVMIRGMQKYPDCAFGISSRCSEIINVFNPCEAYKTHFFERGILDISPSGSIIRNDVFKAEKGFWEHRCVSDLEFWLRLALKYPMIEFEKNLIFWREHDGQEIRLGNVEYIKYNLSILTEKVNKSCLSKMDKDLIISENKKNTMRFLIKNCIKLGLLKTIYFKRLNQLKITDAF